MSLSFERFEITISSTTAAYTDKVPLGHPVLTRSWNRSDMCSFVLHEVDLNDVDVDLDEVVRGDTIELKIDGDGAFFGEVINKQWVHTDGAHLVEIFAQDFLRLGSLRQLDQVINNGVLDSFGYEVSNTLETVLKESIRPLQKVEVFNPHGVYDVNQFTEIRSDFGEISNDGTNSREVAIIFNPRSTTITGLKFIIFDPDNRTIGGTFPGVRRQLYEELTVELQRVKQKSANDSLPVPSNVVETTRGGENASYQISNALQEGWDEAQSFGSISGAAGQPITWVEEPAATGGSTVTMATGGTATGAATFGWNGDYVDIFFDGTNPVGISTVTPRTANIVTTQRSATTFNLEDSHWVSVQFNLSGAGTGTTLGAKFSFFWDNGVSDIEVARVEANSTTLGLIFDGSKIGQSGFRVIDFPLSYLQSDDLYIHFRFHPSKFTFEFFYNQGDEDFTQVMVDLDDDPNDEYPYFDILNKSSFTEIPTTVTKWKFFMDGTGSSTPVSGNMRIGFVRGTEIHANGSNYKFPSRWAHVRFEDDPIDVNTDQKYALVLKLAASATSTRERLFIFVTSNFGIGASNVNPGDFTFLRTLDGGSTWLDIDDTIGPTEILGDFGFMVEYADSYTTVSEGVDFIVDYDNKDILWAGGSNLAASPNKSGVFYHKINAGGGDENGPESFHTVRVSEYENPSSGGLVNSTGVMTVDDVVKQLNKHVDTSALSIGWDPTPTIDAVFATSAFKVDSFVIKQRSINDALRDLSNQHRAQVSLSADSTKRLTFEAVTDIASITVPLATHEYIVSRRPEDDDDFLLILKNDVVQVEEEIFTRFIVKGKTPDLVAVYVNWELEKQFGYAIEMDAQVFSKETSYDNLWLYAQLLNDLHGQTNMRKGEIEVSGYFPTINNRLDANGIIRIIDPEMEDGDQDGAFGTETDNVFKIVSLVYDGDRNTTKIRVSTTPINRQLIEEQLEDQRNFMNGVEPSSPDVDEHRTIDLIEDSTSPTVSTNIDTLYAGLIDENDDEISITENPAYLRQLCHLYEQDSDRDGTTDFRAYSAYFPAGIGTIANDTKPIVKVALFGASVGQNLIGPLIGSQPALPVKDVVFKWTHVGLQLTIWVGHTP